MYLAVNINKFFMLNIFLNRKKLYLWIINLKANHNKDYSVVKTFGLPLVHQSGGIFYIYPV